MSRHISTGALIRAAALAAIIACTAGCATGARKSDAQPSAQGTAFIAHAERICAGARAALKALPSFPFPEFNALHPQRRLLPKVGRFFIGAGNELPIVRALHSRLIALGTPPANPRAWSSLLHTLRGYAAVFRREDAAALRADATAWVDAVRLNRRLQTRLADNATEFGADGCDVL